MSACEVPVESDNLNEISDSVAAMVTCILQEQLAPIREAIRKHSKLLDWHSALLNHSTIMNRYNVGKLDDLRDLQTNVNYKLQFHIDPEDRQRPTFRGPQPTTTSPPQSATIAANTNSSPQTNGVLTPERSPPGNSSSVSSQDRTDPPSGTSSVTSVPDSPARQPTPPFEQPPVPPPTPPQTAADGCAVLTTRRGLRRERAHDEIPDPMWNSSRKINLSEPLPTPAPAPPPPSAPPPPVAARRSETSEATASQASPTTITTQLNDERMAGKKRQREDDTSLCAVDSSDPGPVRHEPERKRKKDTTISTERLPIPEGFLRVARLNIFGDPSFEERRCEVEQMRYMKNLFRGGAGT